MQQYKRLLNMTVGFTLPNYTISRAFFEDKHFIFFYGKRNSDSVPVILKILKEAARSFSLRHEYEILQKIATPRVLKAYDFHTQDHCEVLILEDFQGKLLAEVLAKEKIDIKTFLIMAIELAKGLWEIHEREIIHKNISPKSIFFNPFSKQVKICDFSVATFLPFTVQPLVSVSDLEGNFSYLSPEQTGWINRVIDYRTDIYSLGVTLYEILTGKLPFLAHEKWEVLQLNLISEPLPPHKFNSDIPEALSEIIMKCMAKEIEERYHTAHGLEQDLTRCLNELMTEGEIETFELDSQDFFNHFQIPQKLYERELTIEALLAAVERCSHGHSELLLIKGPSGVGKSSVVYEIQKTILKKKGYFIGGIFDQFTEKLPYTAWKHALKQLVDLLLSASETDQDYWREKLLKAIGNKGALIANMIPELELLIGKQFPEVESLHPQSAEVRFNFVFANFIQMFVRTGHPLVIFLDNLHWADEPSLNLLHLLLSDNSILNLLIIAAYVPSETSSSSSLESVIATIKNEFGEVKTLEVNPLSPQSVTTLLIETFHSNAKQVSPLSEWMHQKTQGNPLFIIQLLRMFYRDNFIQFIPGQQCWVEDLEKIKNSNLPDNLQDFISLALSCLSPLTQSLLALASIIGTTFDLQTLALLHKKSLSETAKDLWEALQEELILSQQGQYGLDFEADGNIRTTPAIFYSFLHNTIRSALYYSLNEKNRQEIYQTIGLLKLSESQYHPAIVENAIYYLNKGTTLLLSDLESEKLATLNLIAGEKAINYGASAAAIHYFDCGIEILTKQQTLTKNNLIYQLYRNKLECQQSICHWEVIEKTFQLALKHAETLNEKNIIYCSQIIWAGQNNNYYRAQELTKAALKMHQIALNLPVSLSERLFQRALSGVNLFFKNYKNLPTSTDNKSLMISRLYHALLNSFIHMDSRTLENIISREINIAFKYGLSEVATITMMLRAYLLCGELQGKYVKGYQLGADVKGILNRFPKSKLTSRALAIFFTSIVFWKQPLKRGHVNLIRMRLECLETGDARYAVICATTLACLLLLRGDRLEPVYKQIQAIHSNLAKYKTSRASLVMIFLNVCESLMGLTPHASDTPAEEFDVSFKSVILENSLAANLHKDYWKAFLYYLEDKFESVISLADKIKVYISIYPSHLYWQSYYFYYALAIAALSTNKEKKEFYWETLIKLQKKMQNWAIVCPVNFLHKHLLLEAEIARLSNRPEIASQHFEKAIAVAAKNEYLHDVAIANELTAKFYLEINENRIAANYMKEAYHTYSKWGAIVKLDHLRKKYPDLLITIPYAHATDLEYSLGKSFTYPSTTTTNFSFENFDADFVIQATQKISEETDLNPLLTKFMDMILSKMDVEQIFVIMPKDQQLIIYAEMSKAAPTPRLGGCTSILANRDRLPLALIQEVEQSKKELLLNNAIQEGKFKKNYYILSKSIKSILCIPLVHRRKLTAILYLENRTTKNAFNLEQMRFLSLLCSQMAISIENAFLYLDLDQKVSERTKKLTLLQGQLVQQEKMASIGLLTAGIAHEIRNPLNFIINFSELSIEILRDLKRKLEKSNQNFAVEGMLEFEETLNTIKLNLKTINEQGNRADNIVKKMSEHAAGKSGKMTPTAIRDLLEETIALSYHGMRARDINFNVAIEKKFDQSIDILLIAPQEISRVLLNLLNNAYYAVIQKKKKLGNVYMPLVVITTLNLGHEYEICIRDNGIGISPELVPKIFTPFFTTKPESEGTGLGLTLSQNIIIQQHGGSMTFNTQENEFTEFIIKLPMSLSKAKEKHNENNAEG